MGWSWDNNPVTGTFLGDASHSVHNTISNINPGQVAGYFASLYEGGGGALAPLFVKQGGDVWNQLTQKANLQTPGAGPNLQNANQIALQGELQQEKNTKATWGMLTGSGGMLDTPTTNSQRLIGS